MAKMKNKEVEVSPQYMVVSSSRHLLLQDLVNDNIKLGYNLIGGVSVVSYNSYDGKPLLEFFQAMEKKPNYFA